MTRKIGAPKTTRLVKPKVGREIKRPSAHQAARVRKAVYDDARWKRARAFLMTLHGRRCLYCKVAQAELLDHYTPLSTGVDPYDPNNLVPCCRPCHTRLTAEYDAIGGVHGNTRRGKPDGRDEDFYRRVDASMGRYRRAIVVKRRKPGDRAATRMLDADPDWTPTC